MTALTDQTFHIIVCGARELHVAERDISRMDRASTVADIRSGQVENVCQVLAINPVEKTCFDVSEDIAREIGTAAFHNAERLHIGLCDFIAEQCGNSFVAPLLPQPYAA